MYNPISSIDRGSAQSGFTLVEALIALIVLSVGMLGIAALLVGGVQSGQAALLRTKAVTLAADMADRIKANTARNNVALVAEAGTAYAAVGIDGGCSADGLGPVADCTPAQMAAHDLFLWEQLLTNPQTGLPGAAANIVFTPASLPGALPITPAIFVITITWNEKGQALSYSLTVDIVDV